MSFGWSTDYERTERSMAHSACDKNSLRCTARLGPATLFFNVYLNDFFMFLEETKVCNYADDTTIYVCGPKIETNIAHLEHDALKITEWFPK